MKKVGLSIAVAELLLGATATQAATFRAETHSRGYVIFSTFEKPERCEVNVYFTFLHNGTTRQPGESVCTLKAVPEGKDVRFCEFSHEKMVDPVISKPLKATCKPIE